MADKVTRERLDDLTGDPADERIVFAVRGRSYEIDLAEANVRRFETVMQPWIDAARDITGQVAARGRKRRTKASRSRSADIRDWAFERNLTDQRNGRLPGWVVDQYEEWEAENRRRREEGQHE
jgi:hypothetical protein